MDTYTEAVDALITAIQDGEWDDLHELAEAVNRARQPQLRIVPSGLCPQHPAYEADYCPECGTSRQIGAQL